MRKQSEVTYFLLLNCFLRSVFFYCLCKENFMWNKYTKQKQNYSKLLKDLKLVLTIISLHQDKELHLGCCSSPRSSSDDAKWELNIILRGWINLIFNEITCNICFIIIIIHFATKSPIWSVQYHDMHRAIIQGNIAR